jgi:hypothetical protein
LLASGALALPLSAEEITVTVPPDPPAQTAAPAQAEPEPEPQPQKSVVQDTTSPPAEAQPSQEPAAAAPPQAPEAPPQANVNPPSPPAATTPVAAPVHKKAKAKATAAKAKTPAKPKDGKAVKHKAKKAAASCKGLDEDACGANSACIWVVGTPAEASSKATKARCRSLAVLKKEASKADKASKSEVLPWARHTTGSAGAASPATTKEAEAKAKAAKK